MTTDRRGLYDEPDADPFERVHEVLAGRLRVPLGPRTVVFFYPLFFAGSNDAVVTRERFTVQFGPPKPRRPQRYHLDAAPSIVSEVLARAGVEAVCEPRVLGLPPAEVSVAGLRTWPYESKLVWVVPGAEVVKLVVRPSAEPLLQPFDEPIPADGPLALRELPEWTPRIDYRELAAPLACPNCNAEASRYREAHGRLVCSRCARSFV